MAYLEEIHDHSMKGLFEFSDKEKELRAKWKKELSKKGKKVPPHKIKNFIQDAKSVKKRNFLKCKL